MQTLEERNSTYTQIDTPQVRRICDLVLNKDSSNESKLITDLSVLDVKTSSNSPMWTNSERKEQNSRVSVKSKLSIIEEFNRYTQGMTFDQKLEYLRMSQAEQTKIIAKIDLENEIKEKRDAKQKEKEAKQKQKEEKCTKGKKEKVYVYVLNMRGKPLMPTSPMKANKLLKEGKVKVVQRCPFTIQLKYPTGENKQPIKLGVDSGYGHVGLSATMGQKELFSAHVELRTDIPDLMKEKAMYRKGKRNRNTRYRVPRWLNRCGKDRREGWLAPSIQHKLDSHVRLIDKMKDILPINNSDLTIEVATFDTQKMMNSEISGIEYQQGTLYGYEVREYLLEKWGRRCAYCAAENLPLEVEHIISRARGGTNRISNLTIACHDCNQKKGSMSAAEFGHPEVQILA